MNTVWLKDVTSSTCSTKCCGTTGYHGGCCSIENRDYIIGPINDVDSFVDRLSHFFNRKVHKSEVFIEFEEGRALFPEKNSWQYSTSYPALRVDTTSEKKQCVFYNLAIKACSIYNIRPNTCKTYFCDYLKSQKEVK